MQNQSGYMYELLNLENGSSVNSDNSDATDLRLIHWQNANVTEYTRRCNNIENIHEVINYKERTASCLTSKASIIILIFIFIPFFSFFIFPGYISDFFYFFVTF